MKKNRNLDSIQAMRGIAALLVVLFHCRIFINNTYNQKNIGDLLFSFGYIGVDLFFIISGFIITYATVEKEKDSGANYIIKRIFRIYPAYLFCLTLLCIFRGMNLNTFELTGGYNLNNILKSIFLIPLNLNSPAPYYGYSLLIVSWTLTYEIFFYFIFFIGMSINHKYRAIISSFIILLGYLITSILSGNFNTDPRHHSYDIKWIELITNPIMLNFVLGMLSYYLYFKIKDIKSNYITTISYLSLGISILLLLSGSFNGHGVLKFGLVSFIGFLSSLFIIEINQIKVKNWILYLGKISYSLYLSHIVIIYSLEKYTSSFPLIGTTNGWSKLIGVVIMSLMLSTIIFRIIEKPCFEISRALLKKKAA